jgi:hypothetical protein
MCRIHNRKDDYDIIIILKTHTHTNIYIYIYIWVNKEENKDEDPHSYVIKVHSFDYLHVCFSTFLWCW